MKWYGVLVLSFLMSTQVALGSDPQGTIEGQKGLSEYLDRLPRFKTHEDLNQYMLSQFPQLKEIIATIPDSINKQTLPRMRILENKVILFGEGDRTVEIEIRDRPYAKLWINSLGVPDWVALQGPAAIDLFVYQNQKRSSVFALIIDRLFPAAQAFWGPSPYGSYMYPYGNSGFGTGLEWMPLADLYRGYPQIGFNMRYFAGGYQALHGQPGGYLNSNVGVGRQNFGVR